MHDMKKEFLSCCMHSWSLSLTLSVFLLLHSSHSIAVQAFFVVGAVSTATSTRMKMSLDESLPTQSQMDEDVSEFHQFAAAAVDLNSGHVSSQSVLSVIRSVRNWELNTRQKYLYRLNLAPLLTESGESERTEDNMLLPPIPLDSSVQMYLPSPSGKKTAVIKSEQKSEGETDEQIIEVWEGSSLTRRIKVGGKDNHGKLINDPTGFGVPSWSPDETCLLYSAERVIPNSVPFWTHTEKKTTNSEKEDRVENRGGQNVLGQGQRESWGECYSKQEAILDLYILNLSTGRLGRVRNVPKVFDEGKSEVLEASIYSSPSTTLGQAVWQPKSSYIAFTGWSAGQPKRLGMVYCKNRRSKIFLADVGPLLKELSNADEIQSNETPGDDSEIGYTCVSTHLSFSRSPRYVEDDDGKDNLIFLGSESEFVSHDSCMGLYRWDDENQVTQNVVPVVQSPSTKGAIVMGMGFPGLFLGQLPSNCSIGNNYLVTTTLWGSFQRVVRIDIKTGDIHLIDIPQLNMLGSHSLCTLATGPNGGLVVSEASCDQPASLWVVKTIDLMQGGKKENEKIIATARLVSSFSPIAASTFSPVTRATEKSFCVQLLTVDSESIDGAPSSPLQALLLLPKNLDKEDKVPMIVIPHGGPHSCSTSTFLPGIAYLANKYAVLLPNYRGSTGFGQASLTSLLTRIGHVDVEDLMLCSKHVINNFPYVDGQRLGICGGSHGGFLTAHCTSQYPEFFKAGKMKIYLSFAS